MDVPDLDRGKLVTVRFVSQHGVSEKSIEINNAPQLIHEIESLALPANGATTIGPDGEAAPVYALQSFTASTAPAITVLMPFDPHHCDRLYAQWAGASATDPVFASAFGALNGAIMLIKPAASGSPVRDDNLPQWLITYPVGATRMQFIAHYEVIYRVGICADRVLR